MPSPIAKQTLLIGVNESTERRLLRALRDEQYQLVFAPDRSTAFATLEHANPELIVIMAPLPGDDPIELARDLRAIEATHHSAIALLTLVNSLDFRISAVQAGVDEFLAKPLTSAVLRARLRAVVQLKQEPATDRRRRRTSHRTET